MMLSWSMGWLSRLRVWIPIRGVWTFDEVMGWVDLLWAVSLHFV